MRRLNWSRSGLLTGILISLLGCGRAAVQEQVTTTVVDEVSDQTAQAAVDPEAVAFEGDLSNRFVPAERSSTVKVRLRITARSPESARRPPINLALVVDTSGSMEGAAIEHAREASAALVEALSSGDRLSLVTFDSTANVLIASTTLERDSLGSIRTQIRQMTARGTTDLAGGLQEGLNQVLGSFDSNGINRIVLLSDGVPNDPSALSGIAQNAGQRGVSITALGLGLEYDEALLGMLAQSSGGRFHYVEDSAQVADVFRDEVLRLQRVVGRSAALAVMTGPGVTIESVPGHQPTEITRGVQLTLGDLVEGESRDLIIQLAVTGRRSGASVELLDAVLTFADALNSAGNLERRLFLGARSTDNDEELASGRNEEVEADAAQIEAAAATVEAINMARNGNVEEAQQVLGQNAENLRDVRGRSSNVRLQADDLDALVDSLPALSGAGMTASGGHSTAARRSSAPNPPAPRSEQRARSVHDRAMQTILGR